MKANKKTILMLGGAIVFALTACGLYAFLYVAMKNKTVATTPLLEKIDELSGRESRITSSLAVMRKQEANIEKLSDVFFNINDIVAFTKKIEELGTFSKTNLTIESLDQGNNAQTGPFLNFRIKATGKFADIERLLTLLENFPGKIQWKTVGLSHSGEGAASEWTVSVSLSAVNFVNQ